MDIKTFKPTDHKIKAVVYGASGSGKTFFAATAPKPIFAAAEAGLLSTTSSKKPVKFVEIKSVPDLKDLLRYLQSEDHGFETVVIDSISEINEIIKEGIEKKKGRMQIQDWGDLARIIKGILRGFRDLPMHTIFIAQELVEKDDQKIQKITPMLNGKAATEIAYFMDIVGYTLIDEQGEHQILTLPNSKYLTKDRSSKIGNECPVDFGEWVKRVSEIEVGAMDVETVEPYAPKATAQKPASVPAKSDKINPKTIKEVLEHLDYYLVLTGNVTKDTSEEEAEEAKKKFLMAVVKKERVVNLDQKVAEKLLEKLKEKIKEVESKKKEDENSKGGKNSEKKSGSKKKVSKKGTDKDSDE